MARQSMSKRTLATAGGVLALGAAVVGGRAWGQNTGPGGGNTALASGPVIGSVAGTGWVTQVARAARTSVVSIDVTGQAQSSRRAGGGQAASGSGTGMLLDTQGDILTNYHVVTLDGSTIASSVQVGLSNGKTVSAQVIGEDSATDLAVIRVAAADVAGLTPIQWADTNSVVVGEPVVAIGYALALGGEPTVTSGVVSAINRQIDEQTTTISGAVQTDAAVNPGNSGGPLLDENGKVIGINTAGLAGTAQGINFAISAQTAQSVVQTLVNGGTVARGYLGVSVTANTASGTAGAKASGAPAGQGVSVQQVSAGSPAAQAGLQAGDVIVKIGDVTIGNPGDVVNAMTKYAPGTGVTVSFYRGSAQQTAKVTVGQRSAG